MSTNRQRGEQNMKLPGHQRSRPTFAETFERDHEQTILAMDQGGSDIPNQAPKTALRLQRVGIKRRSIPVLVSDPLGGGQIVQLSCSVNAYVSLEAQRRGIHVSRIGDLLAKLSGQVFPSLQDYAAQLSELVRAGQESHSAHVSVQGVFTYLENVSGVKEKASLEHLELFAAADFAGDRPSLSSGIGFNHITACPCVQETYRSSFLSDKPLIQTTREGKQMPLLTHSQRCETRLMISGVTAVPTLPQLLACIDGIVVRTQNTLPRELELLNVFRAHAQAQFVEDALRDLLLGIYRLVRERSSEGAISIKSISMESIHDFDLEAEIEFSLRELDEIFGAR